MHLKWAVVACFILSSSLAFVHQPSLQGQHSKHALNPGASCRGDFRRARALSGLLLAQEGAQGSPWAPSCAAAPLSWTGSGQRAGLLRRMSEESSVPAVEAAGAAEAEVEIPKSAAKSAALLFAVFAAAAVCNRILYRIQLVPMKGFTFFIAMLTTCMYCVVYGSTLLYRRRQGIVTAQMLRFAKENWTTFAAIGCFEAVAFAMGLFSASYLPGGLVAVFSQTSLLWTILISAVVLGKRFDKLQLLGAATTASGALLCTIPQARGVVTAGVFGAKTRLYGSIALYLLSLGFFCVSGVLKDKAFKSQDLDVFVVNTFGSLGQFLATLLLLPVTFALSTSLPPTVYIKQGFAALMGSTSAFMPWLTVAYICANLVLNITAIKLIRLGGAVELNIAAMALVPINGLVFCLKIPLLGATPFSWLYLGGLFVVVAGSVLYNHKTFDSKPEPKKF